VNWQGTTKAAATHVWITYALMNKAGEADMSEQEQILFTEGNESCPDGWIEVIRQYGKAVNPARLSQWSDTARDAKECVRTAKIEEEVAYQFQAKLAADAEREAAEAKRLADIEAQKPKPVEEPVDEGGE
jgi:hypothetical protein